MMNFRLTTWLAVVVGALVAIPAAACPFCTMQGQTLTGDVGQASMVLFGTFQNARINGGDGATDLHVEAVIKEHDILGGKKVVTLPRYVPSDEKNPAKFLVFCDVFKGRIDPYRGVPVKPTSDIVKYLKGALAVKDKDETTRLRFFFDYLDNADIEIANDAYKEFGNADAKAYKNLAPKLPPEKLAKWLEDPKTPSFRFGLYAILLGHCGTEKQAALLRDMLTDPKKKVTSGVDGLLAGYVMLKPKEGIALMADVLKDDKDKDGNQRKDFLFRYAGLRAIRFFMDTRPDLVPREQLIKAAMPLLNQHDIADLAIEDLRKWKCFDALDMILALADKESHQVPIIQRAILRFALTCSDKPKAVEFVKAQRKKDAENVKEVEDILRLESTTSK
jgi:hypothetical protein